MVPESYEDFLSLLAIPAEKCETNWTPLDEERKFWSEADIGRIVEMKTHSRGQRESRPTDDARPPPLRRRVAVNATFVPRLIPVKAKLKRADRERDGDRRTDWLLLMEAAAATAR